MDRTTKNFVHKLLTRETHGTFVRGHKVMHEKPLKLFKSIPERFMFNLKKVIPHMGNHIFVGTSRCGRFLITYSYATDLRPVSVQMLYRYRLHWWAFRPGSPAYKVAEVRLFDNQDIEIELVVGIAQWPNINDKLIAYGYSDDGDAPYEREDGEESRRYYITVTTLPSLHNCLECRAVADSFDEEEMAANWDGCIGLSCLKHGLTIHTTLDIAPPYPIFDFLTSLKIDNKIIVNTGNFLHVLSFGSDKQEVKASRDDNIMPAEINHKFGERLSEEIKDYICPWKTGSSSSSSSRRTLTRSVNKAWLNTIMDRAEKVYAFEDFEDCCEPKFKWFKRRRIADKMYEFCSDDEDMENIRPSKLPRHLGPMSYFPSADLGFDCKMVKNDQFWFKEEEDKYDPSNFKYTGPNYFKESLLAKRRDMENKLRHEQMEEQCKNGCDCEGSNVCDNRRVVAASSESVQQSEPVTQQTVSCKSDFDINKLVVNVSSVPPVSSTSKADPLPSKSDYHNIPPLDMSVINPDLSAILAEWEAESISSMSPKSDCFIYKTGETKNDVIQSFLELIPGMTISPRSSGSGSRSADHSRLDLGENGPLRQTDSSNSSRMSSPNSTTNKYSPLLVVLRTRNCNQDKDSQKSRDPEDKSKEFSKDVITSIVKSGKDTDGQRMISGCSVRYDRIYIEVDEEIISNITDIEDDDQGTGFHCALPLSVHGSAYAQLQMVSSQKAEKMNIKCERVYQTTLDIEQFCFKVADIICKCEGYKFWFCDDYDVEIVEICPLNADVLGLVCLRVNAEKKSAKTESRNTMNQRCYYEMRCVFIWNPGTDRCWLEAYSRLTDVTKQGSSHWNPARKEAAQIRKHLRKRTLFDLRPYPPIRTIEHRMWTNDHYLVPSLEEIRDHSNLVGFRLLHIAPRLRRVVDFI